MKSWMVWGIALATWATTGGRAHAATWGAFDPSRMAYDTGDLGGMVHGALRMQIADHGDTVGPAASELTADYLAGVDVFYTGMLSDGTGPTSGSPGTLSLTESAALQDWIAAGGTLVITVDSNGFDGPYAAVYDTWLADYGVDMFAWVFETGASAPFVVHPITEGVAEITWDGPTSFDFGDDGFLLVQGPGGDPLAAVFEPATGFAAGGRILVLGDHNMLTNLYVDETDNLRLVQNIVGWAAGECGNGIVEGDEGCDDGNLDDGDDCDAQCIGDGAGSSGSSGDDTTGGDPTGGGDPTTGGDGPDSTAGDTDGPPVPAEDDGGLDGSGSSDGTSGPAADGDDDGGCGCRQGGPRPATAWWALAVLAIVRRRGSGQRRRFERLDL